MIKSFTVKKSKWVRGEINGDSALLNDDGYMCCLGFLGKSCKINEEDLKNLDLPSECDESRKFPKFLFNKWNAKTNKLKNEIEYSGSFVKFEEVLAHFNDTSYISDKERIKTLQKIFSYKGIKMRVVE